MDASMSLRDLLGRVATSDLWSELARRFGVKFGKIQMAIHDGRPSKFATLDMKIYRLRLPGIAFAVASTCCEVVPLSQS